jgi:hypothetical protein
MTSIHKLPASLIGKMENDWKYDTPSELIRDWPFVNVPTFDDNSNPFCWGEISKSVLKEINEPVKDTPQAYILEMATTFEIKPIDIDTFNSFDKDESTCPTFVAFPSIESFLSGKSFLSNYNHMKSMYRFTQMMMAFYLAKQSKLNKAKIEEDYNNPLLIVDSEREGYQSMILHIWYLGMNWFIECPVDSLDEAWLAFKNGIKGSIRSIKIYIENTDSYGSSTMLLKRWESVLQEKYPNKEYQASTLCRDYIDNGIIRGNSRIQFMQNMKPYGETILDIELSQRYGIVNHKLF